MQIDAAAGVLETIAIANHLNQPRRAVLWAEVLVQYHQFVGQPDDQHVSSGPTNELTGVGTSVQTEMRDVAAQQPADRRIDGTICKGLVAIRHMLRVHARPRLVGQKLMQRPSMEAEAFDQGSAVWT